MRIIYLLLFIPVLLACMSVQAQHQLPAELPDFTLYDLEGNEFKSEDMAKTGRLIVVFYDPGCGFCQKEVTAIGQNYERFENANLYFVAMQDKPLIAEFAQTYGKALQEKPNVKFLHDADYEFINKFNPKEYPSTYVFSAANRRLIRYLSGDTPIGALISVASP